MNDENLIKIWLLYSKILINLYLNLNRPWTVPQLFHRSSTAFPQLWHSFSTAFPHSTVEKLWKSCGKAVEKLGPIQRNASSDLDPKAFQKLCGEFLECFCGKSLLVVCWMGPLLQIYKQTHKQTNKNT